MRAALSLSASEERVEVSSFAWRDNLVRGRLSGPTLVRVAYANPVASRPQTPGVCGGRRNAR